MHRATTTLPAHSTLRNLISITVMYIYFGATYILLYFGWHVILHSECYLKSLRRSIFLYLKNH